MSRTISVTDRTRPGGYMHRVGIIQVGEFRTLLHELCVYYFNNDNKILKKRINAHRCLPR